MRGKDLLYGLNFIDDDLVEEASQDGQPVCFRGNAAGSGTTDAEKGSVKAAANAINLKVGSRRRLITAAACFMAALCVTASISQTSINDMLNYNSGSSDSLNETAGSMQDSGTVFGDIDGVSEDEDSMNGAVSEESEKNAAEDAEERAFADIDLADSIGFSDVNKKELQNYNNIKNDAYSPAAGNTNDLENDAASSAGVSDSRMDSSSETSEPSYPFESDSNAAASGGSNSQSGAGNSGSGSENTGVDKSGDAAAVFDSLDSAELIEYLSALKYSQKAYNSNYEHTVTAPDGTVYSINLSEGFVCSDGKKAVLTTEQVKEIRSLIN